MIKSKGLGRGLSALIGESTFVESSNSSGLSYISVKEIEPNPDQPRNLFSHEELNELANSISKNGVLQPLVLQPIDSNKYKIIAGERRWRAAKLVGLQNVPAIIKDVTEKEVLEIALIENLQRENLSPLEEAESYRKLIDLHSYTQEKVAEAVSKSRSHIANLLRLINLPQKVKEYLSSGAISLGHAKLLVNLANADELADEIVRRNLSVRDTEELIKHNEVSKVRIRNGSSENASKTNNNEDLVALEQYIAESLGMKTKIDKFHGDGNKVTIFCHDIEHLDILIKKLTSSVG